MYENGGNTTHRFLDGHPELFVYPFESQIGTRLVNDQLSAMFPVKYRWPVFALDATPAEDYHAIIDEEGKVRARTPHVSKFRHMPFDFSDDERRERYVALHRGERPLAREQRRRLLPGDLRRLEGLPAQRTRANLRRLQPDHRRRRRQDPVADAERARAARRAQSLVGLRGHQEAAGAALARRLHAGLDAQPALRAALQATCSPTACTSCAPRT